LANMPPGRDANVGIALAGTGRLGSNWMARD
jgi:hypothetical protein